MSLDSSDPRPAYQQIADDLRRMVASDQLQVGDKLPSISEMRDKYDRAVMTLRKAVDVLQAEGLVVTRQGEGTFVIRKPDEAPHSDSQVRELIDQFRQLSVTLDDIQHRLAAVEQAVYGTSAGDDPQRGSGAG